MLESVEDLFETDCGFAALVDGLPYVTVGATTNFLYELEPLKNVLLNFLAHFL
jgi:hypothetical protein